MIVYSASKAQFHKDIFDNQIDDKIQALLSQRLNKRVAPNEIRSWQSSLRHMDSILMHSSVPDDASVAIEYNIPLTAKRVDFLICGRDLNRKGNVVIVDSNNGKRSKPHPKTPLSAPFWGATSGKPRILPIKPGLILS
jgi:hypothetical protein